MFWFVCVCVSLSQALSIRTPPLPDAASLNGLQTKKPDGASIGSYCTRYAAAGRFIPRLRRRGNPASAEPAGGRRGEEIQQNQTPT